MFAVIKADGTDDLPHLLSAHMKCKFESWSGEIASNSYQSCMNTCMNRALGVSDFSKNIPAVNLSKEYSVFENQCNMLITKLSKYCILKAKDLQLTTLVNDQYFFSFIKKKTFFGAEKFCSKYGMRLAHVKSKADEITLTAHLLAQSFWLDIEEVWFGAMRSDNLFYWRSTSKEISRTFSIQIKNIVNISCVFANNWRSGLNFVAGNCSEERIFVCEFPSNCYSECEPEPTTTTTPAPTTITEAETTKIAV
ncbi:uncharacterized protein LOC132204603 [Neocloeon triangulifer]|uniref:uncharacterized protein LOC132204603 n=1 Tax=Neocloeon triangulifer TaxID=2078957 RepID=UPI00286F425F|nr:uncharacterized protein LOC132204603 [Neocloeon triangulifer]